MAYDQDLADRVRRYVRKEAGLSEKRMFGGLAFMINGNMAVAASRAGGLLLRVDPATTEVLITDPLAELAVMGGRELDGWLRIDVDATTAEDVLTRWVGLGITYARSLPSKGA
jgi:TfoX/Sxy family transcriptional regulator of competence genes